MKEKLPLRHSDLGIKRGPIRPHPPLQKKIDREIAEGIRHNFAMHLHYDGDDTPEGMRGYRQILRFVGRWDTRYKDFYNRSDQGYTLGSQRRLHQTPAQFYGTTDEAARIFSIDPEKERRYSRPEEKGGMSLQEAVAFENGPLARLYRRLRTIGYTKNELKS